MPLTLVDIQQLFDRHGARQYSGEPVTQLEHALQTALRAEESGADDALITASLLHDLGHLLNDQGESPTLRGVDDTHQFFAIPFLRGLFPESVLEPIRLHVDAKRYLCATRPDYWQALSEDSKRSLTLQGGIYDTAQSKAFITQSHAADAVKLRQWDDLAKRPACATPSLKYYLDRAARCRLPQQ